MNYAYDGNGNQTQRSIPSISEINFAYDAENRLVGVSGDVTATFTYDGDGNRVQGTIGSVVTAYIGIYTEWISGNPGTLVKYYYAGATRVAMRTGGSTLNYLLGDHLGSNAITTNSSGTKNSEIRYMPWGTTRYTYGTSPTTYQYTGQRVETSLGLLFYNARWYDPYLNQPSDAHAMKSSS
jgi:YD repeat-containing protein